MLSVCFSLKQKDVFGRRKKRMSSLSNPKPNPDVVQRVVADVGHASDLLATIVATSTVHTAVISQKRENISVSDEMSPTTRETLCKNGFVIKRTNVIRKKKNSEEERNSLFRPLHIYPHLGVSFCCLHCWSRIIRFTGSSPAFPVVVSRVACIFRVRASFEAFSFVPSWMPPEQRYTGVGFIGSVHCSPSHNCFFRRSVTTANRS